MVNADGAVNIRIKPDTKKLLDELKVHPRETYHEVLVRLIQGFSPKHAKALRKR